MKTGTYLTVFQIFIHLIKFFQTHRFEESDNGESIVTARKDGPTKKSLAATGVINKYVYEQRIYHQNSKNTREVNLVELGTLHVRFQMM